MANAYVQAKGKKVYTGRHVTVHYDPDKKSIARCAVGPELTAAVMAVATEAKSYAVGISPRPSNRRKKIHYRDSFIIVPGTVHDVGKPPMRRVSARLMNVSPQATIVEVGTSTSPKFEVLRRTLDHLNGSNPLRQ